MTPNKPTTLRELKDWIETSLDGDAHGKWFRAPNFEIIQDVAELLAPRIVSLLTSHSTELLQKIEGKKWQQSNIDDDFIDGLTARANQKMGFNQALDEAKKIIKQEK